MDLCGSYKWMTNTKTTRNAYHLADFTEVLPIVVESVSEQILIIVRPILFENLSSR